MGGVAIGLRPEWSSNNPSQELVDALWDHIEAYWHQEPKERPTAPDVLETLRALGEAQCHTSVVSTEDPDDKAMIVEWEHIEDGPEDGTLFWFGVT